MANNYASDVVKYFKRKTGGDYSESPTYLGAEQRFVGALRNSADNNLEEQYLLGTDCLTTAWVDENGYTKILKEFYIQPEDGASAGDANKQSYRIESTIYKGVDRNDNFYFDKDEMVINSPDVRAIADKIVFNDTTQGDPMGTYWFDDEDLYVYPESYNVMREDKLQYVNASGEVIDVLTKVTAKRYAQDETSGVSKVSVREKFENHLATTTTTEEEAGN